MVRLSESLLQSFRKVALVLSAAVHRHVLTSCGGHPSPLPFLKTFKLALTPLTVGVSALVVSLTWFSAVFTKFLHKDLPSLQGSVLESGLLSLHLPLRRWIAGGWKGWRGNHGYFYVLGTSRLQIHKKVVDLK